MSVGTAATIADFNDPAAANAMEKLAQFKEASGSATDVPGIGDGAAMTSAGIAAYRGDTYVEITNLGLTRDQLIAIAKLAISSL